MGSAVLAAVSCCRIGRPLLLPLAHMTLPFFHHVALSSHEQLRQPRNFASSVDCNLNRTARRPDYSRDLRSKDYGYRTMLVSGAATHHQASSTLMQLGYLRPFVEGLLAAKCQLPYCGHRGPAACIQPHRSCATPEVGNV